MRIYKVLKTGGDNLGGPALTWWMVLGPGLERNHFQHRHEAIEATRVANEAYEAGLRAAEKRRK